MSEQIDNKFWQWASATGNAWKPMVDRRLVAEAVIRGGQVDGPPCGPLMKVVAR